MAPTCTQEWDVSPPRWGTVLLGHALMSGELGYHMRVHGAGERVLGSSSGWWSRDPEAQWDGW